VAGAALFTQLAQAHPGIHHLNGVGHSLSGSDGWLTAAAVGLWALLQTALIVGLLLRKKRS
jgi:hydrogenase/urease accessory protein HupE